MGRANQDRDVIRAARGCFVGAGSDRPREHDAGVRRHNRLNRPLGALTRGRDIAIDLPRQRAGNRRYPVPATAVGRSGSVT